MPFRAIRVHPTWFSCVQSTETGERDEHEPERQAGRASERRQAPGDDRGPLRDPHPAAGTHQVRRVLSVGGVGGQEGHGRHQT